MKPPSACRFLNNKAYFFPPLEPGRADTDPQPLSTPFWCLKTHEPIGPDGEEATDDRCGPGRPCYKPEVEL